MAGRKISCGVLFMLLWWLSFAPGQATLVSAHSESAIHDLPTMVSDSANRVRLLGHVGGVVNTVFVHDHKAYVGSGRTLVILDIRQPATPQVLGKSQPLPEVITGIAVDGNYAYVVAGAIGLQVFNVATPADPLLVGSYDTDGEAEGIYVAGNYAYIADGISGLRIIDINTPAQPSGIGSYATQGWANDVQTVGEYAYVADGGGGLLVINIANPATPREVGHYDTVGSARDIHVVGQHAYIADDDDGIVIVSIADPTKPERTGFYGAAGGPIGVYFADNHVYVSDDGKLLIANVTDPASPQEVATYDTPGYPGELVIVDGYAYVADSGGGLRVVKVTDPAIPTPVGSYDAAGYAENAAVVGNYAYVATGNYGLQIFDISKPATIKNITTYDTPGYAYSVKVDGEFAYIADGSAGVRILNIANPLAPNEVGFYDTPGIARDIAIVWRYAYVADGQSGLQVLNIADPGQPSAVSLYATGGDAQGIVIYDNHAYIATDQSGLRVVNINDPAAPTPAGTFTAPGRFTDVAIADIRSTDNYLYVATNALLRVLSIANPAAPSQVGAYETPDTIWRLAVAGKYAYLASDSGGLRVVDVSVPAAPVEVGFYDTPGYARGIALFGNRIALSNGDEGFYLLRYPDCYLLAAGYRGSGGIPTVNPASSNGCLLNEYLPTTLLTLNASPATGWRIESWTGTNNDNTASKVNQLTMPAADYEVTVNYAPICYPLSLTHNGDGNNPSVAPLNSVGCNVSQFVASEVVTLTANAGTGYIVGGWNGTTNDSNKEPQNTLTMPAAPHTAGVTYVPACYSLTLNHTGSGGDPLASPSQSGGCAVGHYHYADTITLSASPAEGWLVNAWSGTVNNTLTATINSLVMPAGELMVAVHYGEIPPPSPGDAFEADNRCTLSRGITNDGSQVQEHTLHTPGDVDWIRFDAVAGATYRVEVSVPQNSTADVVLQPYRDCASSPDDPQAPSFNPGVRMDISRTVSGPTYLRIAHVNDKVGSEQASYAVTVRKLGVPPVNRALIIVAGRLKSSDPVQPNIDRVAARVYRLFQQNGYNQEQIRLLASDANLTGYTGAANKANLKAAITEWAASRVANGVLTLYLVDHGTPELFYLDNLNNEVLTPSELNEWLTQLESAAPGVKVNVIIEACESGSFIDTPTTISRSGRVILTSSNATEDAKASNEGAYFSDHFLTALQQGQNVATSFYEAREVAKTVYAAQDAWLDADGDGLANEPEDTTLAAQRGFAYPGTLPGDTWAPHIFEVKALGLIVNGEVTLQADVRDDVGVKQVRVVIYGPDYRSPPASQTLQPEILPTLLFTRIDNDNHWQAKLTGLNKSGIYRLLIYAEDEAGLVSRPVEVEAADAPIVRHQLFLPLVWR